MWDLYQKHKIPMLAIGIAFIFVAVWLFGIRTPAWAVYIDGDRKLVVKDAAKVEEVVDQLEKKACRSGEQDVSPENKIELKLCFADREDLIPPQRIASYLKQDLNFQARAAAITVDGKEVVYVDNQRAAQRVLDKIKKAHSYPADGEKLVSVRFEEKVEIKEATVPIAQLKNEVEAWVIMTTGTEKAEKYVVKEGDSLWLIARQHNMYVNDIVQANRVGEDEELQLGQELLLKRCQPYVNVVAKFEGNKVEDIPYETKVVTDRSASTGVYVKQEGKEGEKRISYVEVRKNGVATRKDILEEKILRAAVDKVLVKGGRASYVAMTGTPSRGGGYGLCWPCYGPITQPYRGGHTGIDIGGSTGRTIQAAAGGVVSYTGRQGGYGNFVIINHGGGLVTRYAHLNSINVSRGQRVAGGQMIGTMGSTGRSTGPHLHFEVLSGGSFVNPLNYLR
ncbi:MAG TPA: peptidoglycan DD-metalloendopeptidase family protein [Syntrophomonadaceae bacterium]|nr:peptidoglycan DD-metalloendopeptidase family protein [Syntrophomonadaceae bacterium]